MTEKKVVGSKNDINKSCPKFYELGDKFFYFDKTLLLKGGKNHREKKASDQKMTFLKVVRNFTN